MPTIGVALPVPEPWGSLLQRCRASLGDVRAATIPTHVTLVPPTVVEEGELDKVCAHLDDAAEEVAAFEVHLRGTGSFRPVSPVVFVAVAEGISQIEQLADAVRRGPLARDLDFPFHPHVTIAHHLPEEVLDRAFAEQAEFECRFRADAFHLYVHEDDVGWRPARSFPLVTASALEGAP